MSMGRGSGRGNLLQGLIDRKKEEQRLEKERIIQKEKQKAEEALKAGATAAAPEEPVRQKQGAGRGGLLASLMNRATLTGVQQRASQSEPLDEQEALRQMQKLEKYSPTKGHLLVSPLPTQPSATPTTTALAETEKEERSSSNAPVARGRGVQLMRRLSSARSRVTTSGESGSDTEQSAKQSAQPHRSRRTEAEMSAAPASASTPLQQATLSTATKKDDKLSTLFETGKSSVVSGGEQTAAASPAQQKSGEGASGGTGRTQGTTSSYEKAIEEIKVEHIMKRSPVRKLGESGQKTKFATNYIKLKCKNKGIYQYVVHYDPPIDAQYNRIKLLYQLSNITGTVRLFDGYTLFLPILLDKLSPIKVKRRNDDSEVLVTIQLTKILPPEQIPQIVFNIIFKNIMKVLKMSRIGQHYFSSMRQIEIPNHHLQIWPGYTTAVHEFEDGLYLVIDVAHKVLRSQTCWHLMSDLHQNCGRDLARFRESVFSQLIGSIVLTRYNNKTYKIDDIMWDANPMSTFLYHNNEEITYFDYYKKHYNIEIKDLKQPLLMNRAKKPKQAQETASHGGNGNGGNGNGNGGKTDIICLIPELCFITGLSADIKDDFAVKKDLAVHTRLTPKQRCDQLNFLIDNIRNCPEAIQQISNWGLEFDNNLAELEGRVLPHEKIIFGRREVETDNKCDWTKAAGNEIVVSAVDLKQWLIVYPANKEPIVERFATLAMECSRKIGINIAMPTCLPLRDDRADSYYNEIKKALNPNIQMVCVIFPMLSDARYMRIKKLCCIECPVPSQVIVLKTINKPDNVLKTVAQKIVLQMNCKLGGELWRLSMPVKKAMIVGIDVYHKTEKKFKSIAGFVSSLNGDQTKWYSKVCFQMVGQELTDSLKVAFTQALKKYQEVNNYLPDKIFIYRDGVSEGQLSHVTDHEVVQLKTCFSADYKPTISVIIVQKRINTRIFAKINNDQVNPAPGAVLDHTITSREQFDFFLVSQHVNQGTVTPTHYVVVYDDTNMKPDHIQRLSYKMTHLYYNWSGTIRVPAPCQYAHKLAFLTGQYLQEEPSGTLDKQLYYL